MSHRRDSGYVLDLALQVLLLALILGQIVFLATRWRARLDLTSDQLYTLTDSTRKVIGGLDKRLVIEAYFSPMDELPTNWREVRTALENFLDELVQMGGGKVVLQHFDPNSDNAIKEKCRRLGLQPRALGTQSTTSFSMNETWQGLRLLYGGQKQKVVNLTEQVAAASFLFEGLLTPAIKEVTMAVQPEVGFMEWPTGPQPSADYRRQGQPQAWQTMRTIPQVADRFKFRDLKNIEGTLIPEDIGSLVLFRPVDLTDREKYVIDQFVMRGGTLVVLAEAAEYSIGARRVFSNVPMSPDAAGSKVQFREQLRHYGIELEPKVVADMAQIAHTSTINPVEYYAVQRATPFGMQFAPLVYPYFFHTVGQDWAQVADQLAVRDGRPDQALAEQYRKTFRPGMEIEHPVLRSFEPSKRGPGLYWPCPVGLADRLPEGVTGEVLMRTSPVALVSDPPPNLDPRGTGDMMSQSNNYRSFIQGLQARLQSEPRQQIGLMAQVQGTFGSFFEGREIPKKPVDEAAAGNGAPGDPLEQPIKVGPGGGRDDEDGEDYREYLQDPEKPVPAGQQPETQKPGTQGPDTQGPPVPAPQDAEPEKDQEPDPVFAGTAPGRILVVGDADFLRDDLVRGEYQQIGGPVSATALLFWLNLLEWLAEDEDLLDLRSRTVLNRSLVFAERGTEENPLDFEERRRGAERVVRIANTVVPFGLLAIIGLVVFLVRRSQKQSFLQSVGN